MKIELDGIIHVGETTIAALAKSSVRCFGGANGLSAYGTKQPVAVLIRRDEITVAFEADGTPIPPEEFEQRYPGQRAAFEGLADAGANDS
jgi:hypothetical protein